MVVYRLNYKSSCMSKKIKVAIDMRDLKKGKTGTLTYLQSLVAAFEQTAPNTTIEYKYIHYWLPVYDGKSKAGKVAEHILFTLWKQIILPLSCFFNKVDILFCTDYFLPLLPMPKKRVVVFHDTFFFEHPENYNPIWLKTFRFFAINAIDKQTKIIVPSNYVKKRLALYLPNKIAQTYVVYEAAKKFKIVATESINGWINSIQDWLDGHNYFLYVGTLDKRKNLLRLVKALKIISLKFPNYKLIIAGDSPMYQYGNGKQDLIDLIKEEKLFDTIKLTGRVSDSQLQYLYQNAFGYVFPSLDEGFGLPMLEAMEAGLPILAANNTALPEIGGNASIYFNPVSVEDISIAMEKLITSPTLRMELISESKQRASEFSWEKAATEINQLFTRNYN